MYKAGTTFSVHNHSVKGAKKAVITCINSDGKTATIQFYGEHKRKVLVSKHINLDDVDFYISCGQFIDIPKVGFGKLRVMVDDTTKILDTTFVKFIPKGCRIDVRTFHKYYGSEKQIKSKRKRYLFENRLATKSTVFALCDTYYQNLYNSKQIENQDRYIFKIKKSNDYLVMDERGMTKYNKIIIE